MSQQHPIFLEADLSQAEGREVLALTGDPEMVRLAQTKPWEFDMHVHNMAIVFETTVDALDTLKKTNKAEFDKKRYIGKKGVHGAQRDMGGARLAGELLKDGFVVSARQANGYLEAYHTANPAIRAWFARVRETVTRDRMLTNSWGRRIDFTYDRLDDNVFRQAYSWQPQSEIADLMNQWGVIPVTRYCQQVLGRVPNVQVHDSLLISCWPKEAYGLACCLRDHLERPRLINGTPLSIPVEYKLGRTWAGNIEFKRLPSEAEFTEKAMALSVT